MDSQAIIQGLIDRGIPAHVAHGIAGNVAVESGFDAGINEIAPLVPGSRGGFGLFQHTGPRRVQLEEYAASTGRSVDDPNVQLDFMLWELGNTEKRAGSALMGAQNAEDAARIFSEQFLRPGIPHLDRRLAAANEFAGQPRMDEREGYVPGAQRGIPSQQQNALSNVQMPRLSNALDVNDFMVNVPRVNRLKFT